MFQRNERPASSSATAPEVALEDDVHDLYADNVLSAAQATFLKEKARLAGVQFSSKQPRLGGNKKKKKKNAARNLKRKIRKHDKWPDPYWFDARVHDKKKDTEVTKRMCILLAHEVLETLWKYGDKDILLLTNNFDKLTKDHMAWMKEQLGVEELWGFGIHGDGVPCNYDRTESVIIISINLPGLAGRNGRLRIPLVILPDGSISENTLDDIMEVFAWSMRHLLLGTRPEARHDSTPWEPKSDAKRSKLNGPLPFRACMAQSRADWDWLTKCFHFPGHSTKEGMCWMCPCKRNQVLQFVFRTAWGIRMQTPTMSQEWLIMHHEPSMAHHAP